MLGHNVRVSHTYVLNLDSRPEKWAATEQRLQRIGLAPERFPAIDGETLRDDPAFAEFRHPGALGCLRSHAAIIRDAQARGFEKIAVFEDDVLPRKDFDWAAVDKLPDWRFVYLGATQADWNAVEIRDGYYRPANTLGTWAMLIDSRYFDKLLRAYETKQTADLCLSKALFHDPHTFVLWPYLFISDLTSSDIREWPQNELAYLYKRWRWDTECHESPRSFTASGSAETCPPNLSPTGRHG